MSKGQEAENHLTVLCDEQSGRLGWRVVGWQNTEGLSLEATKSHCRLLLRGVTQMRLFRKKGSLMAGLGVNWRGR